MDNMLDVRDGFHASSVFQVRFQIEVPSSYDLVVGGR